MAIIIISWKTRSKTPNDCRRILFWNDLKQILWQGQVDVGLYSFMNPLEQPKGKSQGRFYSNQLYTLLEVFKSNNQSWTHVCSLCNLIRSRILLSFMHLKHKLLWKRRSGCIFNPLEGTSKGNSSPASKILLLEVIKSIKSNKRSWTLYNFKNKPVANNTKYCLNTNKPKKEKKKAAWKTKNGRKKCTIYRKNILYNNFYIIPSYLQYVNI